MANLSIIEEVNGSASFNFMVSKEDGQVAWTVTPLSINDILSDNDSAIWSDIDLTEPIKEWDTRIQGMMQSNIPDLAPQSKPPDTDIFPSPTTLPPLPPLRPPPPPPSNHKKPTSYINKGTVRIYAHSLRLNTSPLFSHSPVQPSVITVERAALCQIFLETKYHKTFQQPSDRTLRRQTLEHLVSRGKELTPEQREKFNEILKSVESEWSRLSRVRPSIEAFEGVKRLGSGGFGVVNMVKEKSTGQVFAMKSISKERTLRSGHEGRVLCERDLLKKASESGSNWICKLHYAFQDTQALHLVLEYMPGGDFLMLLLQKAPLREDETCFYISEMINGIDACHKLGFMHRDVKPDNFLISASGHLKIADFGLATSGEWIYQESYRSSRRKDLLRRYHKSIISDGAEQTLQPTNEKVSQTPVIPTNNDPKQKRMHADSVVGTYYYMAPEVLHGDSYNATADWWSLGIIMFECLFGYPPFWASTRRATQKIIMDWQNTLEIPFEPRISDTAKRLIKALLTSADQRLRTPTWEIDLASQQGLPVTAFHRMQVFQKDVRNHAFFRGAKIDFERIHLSRAPILPAEETKMEGVRGKEEEEGTEEQKVVVTPEEEKRRRTKDIMLHDEMVFKERRLQAFKNYTYRGRDLGDVLQRFTAAFDNTEFGEM